MPVGMKRIIFWIISPLKILSIFCFDLINAFQSREAAEILPRNTDEKKFPKFEETVRTIVSRGERPRTQIR